MLVLLPRNQLMLQLFGSAGQASQTALCKLQTSTSESTCKDCPSRCTDAAMKNARTRRTMDDCLRCCSQGVIGPGGVQWMTAGRGIIHSEMPAPTEDKMLHGFQLWINLPAKDKMVKPRRADHSIESPQVTFVRRSYSCIILACSSSGSGSD